MKEALTTGEVAKFCGVNFRTVIRWIEKGYMESYKLPGRGDNRVPIASFIDFLTKNNMPVPEELKTLQADLEAGVLSSTASDKKETINSVRRVLVIEDETLMAKAISRPIKRAGLDVDIASNGIEAGIKLEAYKPDLITLDLQLPGMSGFEILEALRANDNYQQIKVVVVSAASKVKMLEVMEHGVDAVIEKPFKTEVLVEKIKDLMKSI